METRGHLSDLNQRFKSVLNPSPGEIHYLWWYMQGSIMNPDVRDALRKAWGMCERHAWLALTLEATLRHGFLMGPAIVYEELMIRAARIITQPGPFGGLRRVIALKNHGVCLMCEMGLGPHSRGFASPEVMAKVADIREMEKFVSATRPFWEEAVCGICAGNCSPVRCRPHLLKEIISGQGEHLPSTKKLVKKVSEQIARYSRSFVWEHRGTETIADRASLISAVGWLSGWRPFLELFYEGQG
jgi:hypothetical protein